jgi:predicted DNA repair protein MutK
MKTMKPTLLLSVGALCLAFAGTSMAATNSAAPAHQHEHGASTATLQLNAGKKWETDAALRQAMGNIREAMAAALHKIHENKLSRQAYAALATKVEKEVGNIVANCKLSAQADEQLHLVIAQLLEGAEQMAGKAKTVKRQDGAVRVIGALEKYGSYFDDSGFKPISH